MIPTKPLVVFSESSTFNWLPEKCEPPPPQHVVSSKERDLLDALPVRLYGEGLLLLVCVVVDELTYPIHTPYAHPINLLYHYTLSTYPINTLSTYPINIPYQYTLSIHPINLRYPHTLSSYHPPPNTLLILSPPPPPPSCYE